MTTQQIASEETVQLPRRTGWQFTLRTLLLLVLCAGFFFSGWTANDWRRRSQLSEQLQGPVQVEHIDATNIFVVRGQKSDVKKVLDAIRETENNDPNGDGTPDEPL